MVEIYRSQRTVVSLGLVGGREVAVKTPVAAIPEARVLACYRRELSLLSRIRHPAVVEAVQLVEGGGRVQLLLEPCRGQTLQEWLLTRRFTVEQVLEFLRTAAEALEAVHAQGVVHQGVNPSNLMWCEKEERLRLLGFSLASRQDPGPPARELLAGPLHYLAPEQTGRVNRGVDHRADYYALGATAWHLLVGQPPFQAMEDPLALIHAHLALTPAEVLSLRPDVPPALSAVIAILLAKDPDRRYQSARGLLEDLRRCSGEPDGFDLGEFDRATRFALPEGLYGRDEERRQLLGGLEQVIRGGRVLALITGPPGVGKSALAHELRGPAQLARGHFASGRHELHGRDLPFQALVSAIREVLRELLGDSQEEVERWKCRLAEALGSQSGVLTGLLPELGLLVSGGAEVPELSPEEARNRAYLAMSRLVRALASPDRPLVLFLDDLQWADAASTELLVFLAGDPEMSGLLLVASSREGEARLEELAGRVTLLPLRVAELDENSTRHLVADACRCRLQEAAPLAQLLHRKTAGNPFFLRALLSRLERERILVSHGAAWCWDLEAVGEQDVSDNVVDIMLALLQQLPQESLEALRLAAAFGHRFSADRLARALGSSGAEVARALAPALELELVVPAGSDHGLAEFGGPDPWYRFSHDRIQEAANQLVADSERAGLHLRLARLLKSEGEPTENSERLYELMDHLMRGLGALSPGEGREFAELALEAGRRARGTGAFDIGFGYFEAGYQALGAARWTDHHELALALAQESARAALVRGPAEILEQRLRELVERPRSFADQLPGWTLRLRHLIGENRMPEAYRLSDELLRRAGRSQPTASHPVAVGLALLQTRWALAGRDPEDLLDLPESRDPVLRGIQEILSLAAPAQALVKPETIPVGILEAVRSVLSEGLTPGGAQSLNGYGLMLCRLGQPELGKRFATLSVSLIERLGRPDLWPRVAFLAQIFVASWTTPMAELSASLRTLFRRSLELGDTWSASNAAVVADTLDFHSGADLDGLLERMERTERVLLQYRPAETRLDYGYLRQTVRALVANETMPEWAARPAGWASQPIGEVVMRCLQLQLAQLYGQQRLAFEVASSPCEGLTSPTLGPIELIYWTYALVALLRGVEEGWATRGGVRGPLQQGRRALASWAGALESRRYRTLWVEAAEARLEGRILAALSAYDQSADLAREAGLRQDAALICQQAAEFCRKVGRHRAARGYEEEAEAGYRQWGAVGLVARREPSGPPTLDLETVLRASQVLSREIRLEHLLGSMLDLAVANAGAERGWLVLQQGENWWLRARAEAGAPARPAQVGLDLDDPQGPLPGALLRYTARTREPLVLEDAISSSRFRADAYVRAHRPRSVLCLPLEYAQTLSGLIYLENNSAPGTFTQARTRVLRTLSGQMAICLENAHHFGQLEEQHAQIMLERERRHHEELRGQALQARQEALAAFLAIASHDLKNPLAAIGVWARQLSAGPIRESIEMACQRAGSLITSYLDMMALETGGELKLHRRPCALDELVEREIDLQLQALEPNERERAALDWDLDPVVATVDPERLQQVVANLVGNALKHCPLGTPIRVRLTAARLEVSDDGPGIPVDLQESLFGAFERRTGDKPGSGLGLWICRVIAQAHGGRLELDSQPGHGCRFWLALP